jgi:hypothetical protein
MLGHLTGRGNDEEHGEKALRLWGLLYLISTFVASGQFLQESTLLGWREYH